MSTLDEMVKVFCQVTADVAQAFVYADEIATNSKEPDVILAWDKVADFLMAIMNHADADIKSISNIDKILGPAVLLQAYRFYLISFRNQQWQPAPSYMFDINKLIDLVYEAGLSPAQSVEIYSLQELARQAKEKK
jgi:hypothetical protein